MSTPQDVLSFWFGEAAQTEAELMQQIRRWFAGGPTMDVAVRERFEADVERAVAGGLTEWESSARDRLALVLLLDQFTRNVFRGSPRTYSGDARAQRLAREAFDSGMDSGLSAVERHFLVMPLVHAEDLEAQERGLAIIRRLVAEATPPDDVMFEMGIEQSQKYRDIIARFGRFPHRNQVMGRDSTPEELELLKDWPEQGPPRKMRDAQK